VLFSVLSNLSWRRPLVLRFHLAALKGDKQQLNQVVALAQRRGQRRLPTFAFRGFTHTCVDSGRTLRGETQDAEQAAYGEAEVAQGDGSSSDARSGWVEQHRWLCQVLRVTMRITGCRAIPGR
jgi:hypothetical protein